MVPVPKSRRGGSKADQVELSFEDTDTPVGYSDNAIINEIRGYLEAWRPLPNTYDWGGTPTTQRFLQHWRHYDFDGPRPFLCQIEAVETVIWLTEVARGRKQYASLFRSLDVANAEADPDLFRLALKLATGAGKTTVMAC